jgi:hypothetical protein
MSTATATEVRESSLLSKVDNAGNTHIYQRKTASDLLVGEHILEHVIGHKPMVATPILAIARVDEDVIVTIPDRHGSNAPVEELYPADKPVFISKTPHLEQYDPTQNVFVQQEKLMEKASAQRVEEVLSNPDDYQRALGVSCVYPSMDDRQVNRALQDKDWIVRMNVLIKAMDAEETDRVDDTVALTLMRDKKPEISMRAQRLFQDRELSRAGCEPHFSQQEGGVMEADAGKGKQFGGLQGAILAENGKWHNLSAYVDKEGKFRGSLEVDGEKHKLEFAEKERDGKKSLGAVVKRENGHTGGSPDMYVRIAAVEGRNGRFASMSLSQKTPDGKWQGIVGKGGGLRMNDALLDGKGVHSKEAQFIEKTLDVGPGALIPVKARENAIDQGHAAPTRADYSREAIPSQGAVQTVTLGEEPGNQRRWTGKIVGIAEDRKSVDMQSAGKVSRVVDGQGKEFPADLAVGSYGKLLHDKTGPKFAAQEQQRSQAKEKGKGGREISV